MPDPFPRAKKPLQGVGVGICRAIDVRLSSDFGASRAERLVIPASKPRLARDLLENRQDADLADRSAIAQVAHDGFRDGGP